MRVVQETRPAVVLMDLSMPGVDGTTAIRELTASGSPTCIVVLTSGTRGTDEIAPSRTGGLCEREREVLALVAAGLANNQIGHRLGISERTVKAHVGSIFRQIGVRDRTSAALWPGTTG